jgi:hypothetical protein
MCGRGNIMTTSMQGMMTIHVTRLHSMAIKELTGHAVHGETRRDHLLRAGICNTRPGNARSAGNNVWTRAITNRSTAKSMILKMGI